MLGGMSQAADPVARLRMLAWEALRKGSNDKKVYSIVVVILLLLLLGRLKSERQFC
jgi:hypothetical protein